MARRQWRYGFLTRSVAPFIVGTALTAAALLWFWGDAEREDLTVARPTILDFGRPPSPLVPKKLLTADAPPPLQTANSPKIAQAAELPLAPPPASFEALFSRVTVLDATRFRTIRDRETLVIHLAGINGAAFSDACEGPVGRWNCGARARADLARLIGPRAIGCINIAAKEDDGESRADCWVGNRNLSVFMVSRGWAEPIDPADPLLAPYAAKAKTEKLGRYGDGSLQPPDPT
ncbi:thermonuclease family protein [Pleomorphomonas oryzae]|uniref:thermonuclease family protein n=1 Tax=Pleomorphomonas oryzae TaxID=261934 RepID=UPI0004056900|nr:thermonuclease family protein [Pleomorphomonas oryzae]